MFKISIILLIVACLGLCVAEDQEQVDTSHECATSLQHGKVLGALIGTQNSYRKVCAYTAIPYAKPPVGKLRFQAPEHAHAWGTLNATSLPNVCPQAGEPPKDLKVKISEDCLYLNVYQPRLSHRKKQLLPVMVWIHGGGFTGGSSIYYTPFKLLARGNVILVVLQYRLGLLGFLSTGDAMVPGNNGLKDQAFAIKWVHENVKSFGGNPHQVTIFGESAGGASVNFQLISPVNKGLIHGVIAQSGTALGSWAIDRNPRKSARIMARRLGCSTLPQQKMVNCLKKMPWKRIIKAQNEYSRKALQDMTYPYATMTPVVEHKKVKGAFITDEPTFLMKHGNFGNIPVMLGSTKHEGSYFLAYLYLIAFHGRNLDKNADYMKHQIVPDILKFINEPETNPENRAIASSVELAYMPWVNRSDWDASMPGLVDMLSVFYFKSSIQKAAEMLVERKHNVYLYSFEHSSRNTLFPPYFRGLPVKHGVSHGDELMYLFDFPGRFTRNDNTMSTIMCGLWLNFANHGKPAPDWEPYSIGREAYAKLDVRPKLNFKYRQSWRPNSFRSEGKNDTHQYNINI